MKRHGWKYGLSVDHIGKSFTHYRLGKMRVEGMSGTTKIAIVAENGKRYVMRADEVARSFGVENRMMTPGM